MLINNKGNWIVTLIPNNFPQDIGQSYQFSFFFWTLGYHGGAGGGRGGGVLSSLWFAKHNTLSFWFRGLRHCVSATERGLSIWWYLCNNILLSTVSVALVPRRIGNTFWAAYQKNVAFLPVQMRQFAIVSYNGFSSQIKQEETEAREHQHNSKPEDCAVKRISYVWDMMTVFFAIWTPSLIWSLRSTRTHPGSLFLFFSPDLQNNLKCHVHVYN